MTKRVDSCVQRSGRARLPWIAMLAPLLFLAAWLLYRHRVTDASARFHALGEIRSSHFELVPGARGTWSPNLSGWAEDRGIPHLFAYRRRKSGEPEPTGELPRVLVCVTPPAILGSPLDVRDDGYVEVGDWHDGPWDEELVAKLTLDRPQIDFEVEHANVETAPGTFELVVDGVNDSNRRFAAIAQDAVASRLLLAASVVLALATVVSLARWKQRRSTMRAN